MERVCGRLKEKATRVEKEKADKELFATIAVRPATLLLSAGRHQVEKEKEKVEKEKCGMFMKLEKKTGALIHKQAHQRSRKQEQHQQQKGNEQVRRLVTTPMPIIEEVDDEDYVDLIGMFEDLAHDWSVRVVKMTESKKLVKVANMADGSDEEEYEKDELHKWYEDLEVDKLNSKKAVRREYLAMG